MSGSTVVSGRVDLALRWVAAVASGVLCALTVAPWFLAPLHWFALVPLFWALRADSPRMNLALLLVSGTLSEAMIFSWIIDTITLFSNLPTIAAVAVLVVGAAMSGLPWTFSFAAFQPLRRRLGSLWVAALPAWLVVVDWLGTQVILFPWQHGVSQYRTPWIWQIVSLGGIGTASYLVIFVNAALAEAVLRRRERRPAPWGWLAAAAGLVAATLAFGAWRHAAVEAELAKAPVVKVFQIQTETDMAWRMTHSSRESLAFWLDHTAALKPGEADLVVWPEGAVPPDLNAASLPTGGKLVPDAGAIQVLVRLWQLARDGEFDMVVGSGTREVTPAADGGKPKIRDYNSVYFFARARLAVPADAPGPEDTWAALVAAGCDPDAVHVVTPFEAEVLAAVGRAAGDATGCADRLAARAGELGRGFGVPVAFRERMASTPGFWAAFRHQTSSFGAPLRERSFFARSKVAYWTLEDADCPDQDCAFVVVQCADEGTCEVFPSAPHYDKLVPLPFGEYIPYADTFPWLADLIEGPGNFRAGTEAVVFEGDGFRLSTPICYEGILGEVCRRYGDPDVLVNVTNDAWYGRTGESDLHGMLVTVRAAELGVPVVRSTWSGTSFVVEPHGDVLYKTPIFTEVVRVVPVRMGRVDTLYRHIGDSFVGLCAALVAGLLAWARTRRAT